MKRLTSIFVGIVFGWTLAASAAEDKKQTSTAPTTNAPTSNVQQTNAQQPTSNSKSPTSEKTEHNFEDLLVQGKYHFSDEAVTTVEEDKVLDSLLGIRTDFKDKIEQSAGRY